MEHDSIGLEQRHQSTTTVIGAKTVEQIAFLNRGKGITSPGGYGLHSVDMCIQHHCGTVVVPVLTTHPEVVAFTPERQIPAIQILGQFVGSLFLVTADRRDGYQFLQQF